MFGQIEESTTTKPTVSTLLYLALGLGILYFSYSHPKKKKRRSLPIRSTKTRKTCPSCGGYMEKHSRGRKGTIDYEEWYYCQKCGEYLEV